MGEAKLLINLTETVANGRYRIEIKAYEVEKSKKYPEGVKARYILVDVTKRKPRLLIDNHAPFGFHIHAQLPEDKNIRETLKTSNYLEALDEFLKLLKEVISRNED